ncbi:double-strand break repair helicase AddA [Sulfitobacter guttiformis]|uniref:DNA 3'-5' helicase n=1 Tax=Sulfitobacter guttiformis TaxID=74349 RepID=A0A420DSA6_9RHOB|nr:double-strand break repair helicase AddA [Sulfitobacter guttiformis]KIN74445.1 ATP-dependent DNA helicase, UvrD/Rep family protein [Sulfitobacter guttiformis KCTC 32187]RKE97043.1 DNA helicase/exodeoxyribonuclease V subunit A [Sulfitobacter guttiformis]
MTTQPQWDEATRAQITAARPDTSTWLSANAGSGKTRVLTDRVARLLLDEVKPQHILCLTYTKAAASEMQNRLFKRLGEWAMMEDDDLREGLRDLGVLREIAPDKLREARTLFAQAIETPGGLKIQTIHSFCASLLRRFPLEAGVSPQFKEIEDRAAELLRADVLDSMAEGQQAQLVTDLAAHYTGESFASLTQSITGKRELFGSLPGDLNALFDLPDGFDINTLPAQVMDEAVARWMPDAIEVFAVQKTKTMPILADALRTIDFTKPSLAGLEMLKSLMLTQAMEPRKSFPTKDAKADLGPMLGSFEDLAQRTYEAHDIQMRARNVSRTGALHRFAAMFISRYEAEKQRRGWLDFDDLILRARALLNDPKVAAWVLYRIDGGIDHILVDEAQDTSPRQWDVIEKLADEFASGSGARDSAIERTLFVVGDKKQSIYSFQGADPREFDHKRTSFGESLRAANLSFQDQSLDYSFRSSPAILRAVDQTFNTLPDPRMDQTMTHLAFKEALPGRVDIWPVIEADKTKEDEPDWTDPVDRKSTQHHTVILADQIAGQIKYLVEGEHYIPDDGKDRSLHRRRITEGDFLILVRGRKTGLFSEIIRACKVAGLKIAGADRLKVGAELAVRDIGALLSFLSTPDDALALATALRSPLFGWTEQELFTLAHHRPAKQDLWQSLRTQTDTYPDTLTVLHDLRSQVDFLRPYDLIERILTRHHGRRNLLARMGTEAEDGIDALLGQALAYERTEVPSLTGFLEWMQADDLEIKRQIDSASDQIRVMTVHGAKGLEAPIVILPDTGLKKNDVKSEIITLDDTPIWKPNANEMTQGIAAHINVLKEAQTQEGLRLLYVAMTRAEKWLIVAAAGDLGKDGSWYQMVDEALGHLNAVSFTEGLVNGKRHEEAGWDTLPIVAQQPFSTHSTQLETVFSTAPPPAPVRTEVLSPSDLGGAKALGGEAGMDEEAAKSYGTLVHMLLEHLAPLDGSKRASAGRQLMQRTEPAVAEIALFEAISVLENHALSPVFAPSALAEVAVTARIGSAPLYGIIDRLVIEGDRVLAVDFKTNRTVPETPEGCPEGLLRQMGAYDHALRAIYPDHRIETAILWTHTGTLMLLPHNIVTAALHRTGHLDAGNTPS